jgi:hypothetical protein
VSQSAQLKKDIESARQWLVEIGLHLNREAMAHNDHVTKLLDKVILMAVCADLPGDMPLRIRVTPNVFGFKA